MVSSTGTEFESPIKARVRKYSKKTATKLRRGAILIMGLTIILIGVALLILPGPGVVTIIFGLTLLSSEFYWAKKWLTKVENSYGSLKDRIGHSNVEKRND